MTTSAQTMLELADRIEGGRLDISRVMDLDKSLIVAALRAASAPPATGDVRRATIEECAAVCGTDLKELAARCEAARSADWQLSVDIFRAIGLPKDWFGSNVISWFGNGPFGCNTEDGIRHLDCINAPDYTGSIDQAMSLFPSGFSWDTISCWPTVCVRWYPPVHDGKHCRRTWSYGATVALALCNAALTIRALASVAPGPSEAAIQKSAPVILASHNSGERDPAVTPDWAGADTEPGPRR